MHGYNRVLPTWRIVIAIVLSSIMLIGAFVCFVFCFIKPSSTIIAVTIIMFIWAIPLFLLTLFILKANNSNKKRIAEFKNAIENEPNNLIDERTLLLTNLLKEGRLSPAEKKAARIKSKLSGAYWCLVVAVFLVFGIGFDKWQLAGIIFPVSGVVYAAFIGIVKIFTGSDD